MGELCVEKRPGKKDMGIIAVVAVADRMYCVCDAYRSDGLPGRAEAEQWLLDLANARRME